MSNSIAIPQCSPHASYLAMKEMIDSAVRRVMDNGLYILGPEVQAFEAEFAEFLGCRHAVGVASGTDAIELALRACGIGPGDSVATVSLTASATAAAIERTGAQPIWTDIDPVTCVMSPRSLLDLLSGDEGARIKAVVPVHLYGNPVDMDALMHTARNHGLHIIEDCAQAHGASYAGRPVGTFGDASAFSFYPTKNLGAFGDGGMVVTNSDERAEQLRWLRQYGWKERYVSLFPGTNSRLDELQAAILRVKLRGLTAANERRRTIADTYTKRLAGSSLVLPRVSAGGTHVFHQYVVRSLSRETLRKYLTDAGIGTLIHYPVPLHKQAAYAARIPCPVSLAQTDRTAREVLSLPMFPELTDAQVCAVVSAVQAQTASL